MRIFHIFIYLILLGLCNTTTADTPPSTVYTEEEPPIVWTGPGWYYGVWFDNEVEYDDWYHHHDNHDKEHTKNPVEYPHKQLILKEKQ